MAGYKKHDDDLDRVIEKNETDISVTKTEVAGKLVIETFREKLAHLLHTTKFQICVICLVIVDCMLVIGELLVDLEIIETGEENPAPHVLHYMSIGILSVFMIEIFVKIYALRLEFFKDKLEVFDAIVVIVSFSLDIAFRDVEGLGSGSGLLILLRLWRVTRIINGIVLSVKTQAEGRLLKERRARESMEQELEKFREYYFALEREIETLQGLLRKHRIEFETVERPVIGSTMDVVAEVNRLCEKISSDA